LALQDSQHQQPHLQRKNNKNYKYNMAIIIGTGITIQGGIVVGDLVPEVIPGTQIVSEDYLFLIVKEEDGATYIITEQ
jgi:hypothetical protein